MKRPIVIKAGGEMFTGESSKNQIFLALKRLHAQGPVIFVHGGGPQIKKEMDQRKIKFGFVGGRRSTSVKAMDVVEQVLSGVMNKNIAAHLSKMGVMSVGISGRDGMSVVGRPIPKLGRAAKPIKVNPGLVQKLLKVKALPVFSTVASDSLGKSVNINADDAASALAVALKAEKLIFLTDVSGVFDGAKKRIPILKIKNIKKMIAQKIIFGGMIPKIQSAAQAIQKGVGEVDILNGRYGINFKFGTRIIK